jgi:hypothetical protein
VVSEHLYLQIYIHTYIHVYICIHMYIIYIYIYSLLYKGSKTKSTDKLGGDIIMEMARSDADEPRISKLLQVINFLLLLIFFRTYAFLAGL